MPKFISPNMFFNEFAKVSLHTVSYYTIRIIHNKNYVTAKLMCIDGSVTFAISHPICHIIIAILIGHVARGFGGSDEPPLK